MLASKVYFDYGDGPNESGPGRKHIRTQIEGTLEDLVIDGNVVVTHNGEEITDSDS